MEETSLGSIFTNKSPMNLKGNNQEEDLNPIGIPNTINTFGLGELAAIRNFGTDNISRPEICTKNIYGIALIRAMFPAQSTPL
eukprot:9590246-Ditylum_brightwellii.AAC.1